MQRSTSSICNSKEFSNAVKAIVKSELADLEKIISKLMFDVETLRAQNKAFREELTKLTNRDWINADLSALSKQQQQPSPQKNEIKASPKKDAWKTDYNVLYGTAADYKEPIYDDLNEMQGAVAHYKKQGVKKEKDNSKTMPVKQNMAPKCATCCEEIQGKTLTALGKTYHPEHFVCYKCKKAITDDKFQTHLEKPYCGNCFAQDFLPKCHSCRLPIKEKVIKAMGRSWHTDHFTCSMCKANLAGGSFMQRDDKPLCQKCFEGKYADKCKQCGKPISEKTIVALDAKWHPDCFKCVKCKNPIVQESFSVEEGHPVCMKCS